MTIGSGRRVRGRGLGGAALIFEIELLGISGT
jgi:hypothetical protein